jgi:hypothetical protein
MGNSGTTRERRSGSGWFIGGIIAFLTLTAVLLGSVSLGRAQANQAHARATSDLFSAIFSDSVADAKAALDAGADPNGRIADQRPVIRRATLKARAVLGNSSAAREYGYQECTALAQAIRLTNNPAMVSLLLNRGARPDARIYYGETPLHRAVNSAVRGPKGDPYRAITRLLLAAGADPNAADGNGNTPLMLALFGKADSTTIRILLDAGADPDRKNARGVTARTFLTPASDPAVVALFRR